MDNCLHCQSELIHVPGRKKKRFCNETCRSNHWYGKNKKGKKKEAKVKITDLAQVVDQIKPEKQPKTNFTINTTSEERTTKTASNPFRDEYRRKKLGLK